MIVIDKLCYQSKLRYTNASEKFMYAVLSLIICIISRSLLVALILLCVNGYLTVRKGQIPLSRYLKLFFVPLIFLIAGTIAIFINFSKVPLDLFALQIGAWYITGSYTSLVKMIHLIMTALAAVSCLYFLSLNTTMTDILGVMKKIHIPDMVIELMLLIYRFIFILLHTASAISISQEARLGNRDFQTKVNCFGKLGVTLFILSLKRANALYDAMEARCYDGSIRVLRKEYPAKTNEIVMIILFELFLICVAVITKTTIGI